jgi:hypothetical protein
MLHSEQMQIHWGSHVAANPDMSLDSDISRFAAMAGEENGLSIVYNSISTTCSKVAFHTIVTCHFCCSQPSIRSRSMVLVQVHMALVARH